MEKYLIHTLKSSIMDIVNLLFLPESPFFFWPLAKTLSCFFNPWSDTSLFLKYMVQCCYSQLISIWGHDNWSNYRQFENSMPVRKIHVADIVHNLNSSLYWKLHEPFDQILGRLEKYADRNHIFYMITEIPF